MQWTIALSSFIFKSRMCHNYEKEKQSIFKKKLIVLAIVERESELSKAAHRWPELIYMDYSLV